MGKYFAFLKFRCYLVCIIPPANRVPWGLELKNVFLFACYKESQICQPNSVIFSSNEVCKQKSAE